MIKVNSATSLAALAELMGDGATEADAANLRRILFDSNDTREISNPEMWSAFCAIARRGIPTSDTRDLNSYTLDGSTLGNVIAVRDLVNHAIFRLTPGRPIELSEVQFASLFGIDVVGDPQRDRDGIARSMRVAASILTKTADQLEAPQVDLRIKDAE